MLTSSSATPWHPLGFSDYRRLFPDGPRLEPLALVDATAEFVVTWDDLPTAFPSIPDACFVFVRGLFGSWIPRHFARPVRALTRMGLRAIIAKTDAVGTIEENSRAIERDVLRRTRPDDSLVFLCHSKGGLDALAALLNSTKLRTRTAAVALCQVPRGGCPVLEAALLGEHVNSASRGEKMKERLAALVLDACGARPGCLDVTGRYIEGWVRRIDACDALPPIVSVASWSSDPTSWLESQHERMKSIRAGWAHDGLFFSEHLVWPTGEQVLLPRLDHSQPCVGGSGFDHGRFWLVMARLALRSAVTRSGRAYA